MGDIPAFAGHRSFLWIVVARAPGLRSQAGLDFQSVRLESEGALDFTVRLVGYS